MSASTARPSAATSRPAPASAHRSSRSRPLLVPPDHGRDRPAERFRWGSERGARALIALVFIVGVYALPFINSSNYLIQIMTTALIYVMLAMGLNVVVGFAGLLDLGYIAFFAVGAYTSGIFTTRLGWPMWAAIPPVIVFCVIAGVVIGGPTLRLRSDYLAIVTLGFGEIIRLTANNLIHLTGGPSGIFGIPTWRFGGWSFTDGITIGGIHFDRRITFYYFVATIVLVVGVVGLSRLAKGRLGRAWQAVRDDEDAAEAMGINTYMAKITAYIIGAVWAGLAGQLMASHISTVSPTQFQFLYSALVLCAVVIGGMGSMPGAIIGAFLISLMPEVLRDVWENRYLLFGALLLVVMIFRPKGIWPSTGALPWSRDRRLGTSVTPAQLRHEARQGLVTSVVGAVLLTAGLALDGRVGAGVQAAGLVTRLAWMAGAVMVLFGVIGLIRAQVDLRRSDKPAVTRASDRPAAGPAAAGPAAAGATDATGPATSAGGTPEVVGLTEMANLAPDAAAGGTPPEPAPAVAPDPPVDASPPDVAGPTTPDTVAPPTGPKAAAQPTAPEAAASASPPAAAAGRPRDAAPILEVSDLSLNFGGVAAVDGLSLTVYPGEIVSVIGPNGAGKTSAFNCISGFYRADSGTIRLHGRRINSTRPSTITKHGLARTFQNLRLFRDMTILDNVLTAAHSRLRQHWFDAFLHTPAYRHSEREAEQRARGWLDFVGFTGDERLYVSQLPYGEQRRVEIARALNASPQVLLLDEPAAGLNHNEKRALIDLIARIQALGVTIVLIEHDMGLVMRVSERVVVLNYGKAIAVGTPDEIRADPVVIEAYLGSEEAEEAAEAVLAAEDSDALRLAGQAEAHHRALAGGAGDPGEPVRTDHPRETGDPAAGDQAVAR